MATATYNGFQDFTEQLVKGTHNFSSNVFKVYLSNDTPSASADAVKADLGEITGGNGYTSGGETTTTSVSETGGTATVTGTQVSWTATGTMATFRYVVLYNDTSASDNLVAWWDYGSAISLTTGESFTVKFSNASPGNIFTLALA
jgi:hypothetical protein